MEDYKNMIWWLRWMGTGQTGEATYTRAADAFENLMTENAALQEAYDDMAGDLELRTQQVRQLQEEIAVLRGQNGRNEPLTLDKLKSAEKFGYPVWLVGMEDGDGLVFIHHVDSLSVRYSRVNSPVEWSFLTKSYGVRVFAYLHKPGDKING